MTVWTSGWAFLFLLPLVFCVFWMWWRRHQKTGYIRFSSGEQFKKISPSLRARTYWVPDLLKVIALVFAICAMARPQKADEKVKRNVEGIDIMVTIDISESMLIEDMQPVNRLESVKQTVKDFISRRTTDRLGLVVFSGESYTRVPLTLDYEVLQKSLAELKTSRNIKMGTAIGVALANAAGRLRDSNAKSRVIILLTDGENNTGLIDPLTALRIAKGYGIKVYTIGAGKDGQAQLPITDVDVFGRTVKRYQPIHSSVNVQLLTQIAEETGGKFYLATDTTALQNVFDDINQLEKTKIDVDRYVKYQELFQGWLYWAVIIYAMAAFLQLTYYKRGI